jgi:hypothetical protein
MGRPTDGASDRQTRRISSAIVAIGTDRWGILAILVMMGVRQQPMSAFKSKADIGFSEVHVWF